MIEKIPKHAKKIHSYKIFDLYAWEQEMFDGSKQNFEMIRRQDSALALLVVDSKIMINKQEQPLMEPHFSLPGGLLEWGEDEEAGLRREILEETGYTVDSMEKIFSGNSGNVVFFNMALYIAKAKDKIQDPKLDPGEKIENFLVDWDEFEKIFRGPGIKNTFITSELRRILLDENLTKDLRDKLGC